MIEPYAAVCIQPALIMCEARKDIKKNLERYEQLIDFAAGFYWEEPCKLICFPEYFLQGVTTPGKGEKTRSQVLQVAVEIPGEETEILAKKAKEYSLYIIGHGIAENDPNFPGHWFNTAIIIDPKGDIILKYHKWYIPAFLGLGTSPHDVLDKHKELYGEDLKSLFPVVDTEIGKLGTLTCYDGFGFEISRALAFNGAEVLSHGTAVMEGMCGNREDVWTLMNRANAYANTVYVIAPNWGTVDYKYYPKNFCPGRSQIIDYNSTIIAEAGYPGESVIGALIDIEALRVRRSKVWTNQWASLRAEPFKEIYGNPIYPPNRFLDHPPETQAAKMAYQIETMDYLYERGILTRPSGDVPDLKKRMKRAQERGTLRKQ